MQECFKNLGYEKNAFPNAVKFSEQLLSLPMFPELTDEQIEYICSAIKKFYL